MTFDPLPLQEKIKRNKQAATIVRAKKFGEAIEEILNERVNPVKRVWNVAYIPVTLAERDVIKAFLATKATGVFFTFIDRCNGTEYEVRRKKDSLVETKLGANYLIRFTIYT